MNNLNIKRSLFTALLQVLLLLIPVMLWAEPYNKPNITWSKTMNSRTGRYVSKGSSMDHSVSLALDAIYYYGDVENHGLAIAGGPLFADNIGGMAKFNYHQPVSSIVKMRYSLGGGYLRGNNQVYAEKYDTPSSRKFNSWVLNAAVGVDIFPIIDNGFYIYVGFMFNYSNVNFFYNDIPNPAASMTWSNHSFLPMIPVELGYQFTLGKGWSMNVHVGVSQGLVDGDTFNLDAWPHHKVYDDYPNIVGTKAAGGYDGPNGNRTGHCFDGWFNLGVTISYSWHKCEICRLRKW